jgi:hypothetical protein
VLLLLLLPAGVAAYWDWLDKSCVSPVRVAESTEKQKHKEPEEQSKNQDKERIRAPFYMHTD